MKSAHNENNINLKELAFRYIKKHKYKVYGDFVSEFGEEFIVYGKVYSDGIRRVYVTGDELDWEIGWIFNNRKILKQEFELNQEEFDMIKDIINKVEEGTSSDRVGRIIARRLKNKKDMNE